MMDLPDDWSSFSDECKAMLAMIQEVKRMFKENLLREQEQEQEVRNTEEDDTEEEAVEDDVTAAEEKDTDDTVAAAATVVKIPIYQPGSLAVPLVAQHRKVPRYRGVPWQEYRRMPRLGEFQGTERCQGTEGCQC